MAKKKQTTEWYNLERLLHHNASIYSVIGMRSNGKTYSVKKYIIDELSGNDKFMYIRRRHRYITRSKMQKLYSDISEYTEQKWGDSIKYSTEKGFYIINKEGNDKTVGYCTSIEDAYVIKSIPYNDVKIILFDEFIDAEYMEDEIPRFLHVLSTIVRDRQDVKIFMLANTISKYCPYLDLFRIDINKIKMGDIAIVKHTNGATVALEYCPNKVDELGKKKKHKYLGFDDNKTVDMILYGEWEYKNTNIKGIDGITWSSHRKLCQIYVTAIKNVYEMSIFMSKHPIAFIRKINTQNGMVNVNIKYNLSYDSTVILSNKNGVVPLFKKLSKFMNQNVYEDIVTIKECIRCGRAVFDDFSTGTEFVKAFNEMV